RAGEVAEPADRRHGLPGARHGEAPLRVHEVVLHVHDDQGRGPGPDLDPGFHGVRRHLERAVVPRADVHPALLNATRGSSPPATSPRRSVHPPAPIRSPRASASAGSTSRAAGTTSLPGWGPAPAGPRPAPRAAAPGRRSTRPA